MKTYSDTSTTDTDDLGTGTLAGEAIAEADRVGEEKECEVGELVEELRRALQGAEIYLGQQMRDYETAFALWQGQSPDERQWDDELKRNDAEAFPWDGASDKRVFYADGLIMEQARVMLAAVRRMKIQATPLRGAGLEEAQNVSTLMTWLTQARKKAAYMRQLGLLARWRQHFGYAVLGVTWREDTRVRMEPLRIDDLRNAAMQASQAWQQQGQQQQGGQGEDPGTKALAMIDVILDPARDDQAIGLLQLMSPLVTKPGARKMLRDLRQDGETMLATPEVIEALPSIKALRLYVDVFMPANSDLQNEEAPPRWVARRQWMTEAQLRGYATQFGWDEDWLEEVIEKGRGQSFDLNWRGKVTEQLGRGVARTWWQDAAEMEHMIEIIWHYRLGIHDEYDLPCMWLTVYNHAVEDRHGYDGPAGVDRYPFFGFTREAIDDATAESRGTAELARGVQQTIKTEMDAFANRASINVLPPLLITAGAMVGRTSFEMGPGVQHSIPKGQSAAWLALPQTASDSEKTITLAERYGDRYFGRMSETVPEMMQQLSNEDLAGGFLDQLLEPMKFMLALMQENLPPTVVARVTGEPPMEMSKTEIRGSFDLQLVFNPDDLNMKLLLEKLAAWSKFILPADTVGATNRFLFIKTFARLLDRDMADQMIMQPQQAGDAQIKKAKDAMTAIMTGIEPQMSPEGEDYQAQLMAIQGMMQNPELPKRLQRQPDSMALLQRYVEHLKFEIMQQQNAQTGKVGVPPLDWAREMEAGQKQLGATSNGQTSR